MALDNFLKRFICKDPKEHNYTKIASQKLNIFGGSGNHGIKYDSL